MSRSVEPTRSIGGFECDGDCFASALSVVAYVWCVLGADYRELEWRPDE